MTEQVTFTIRPDAEYIMTGPAIDMPAVSHNLPSICTKGQPDDPEKRVRERVMTAAEMMPKLRKTGRYCVHHGSTRKILTGTKLLNALSWMNPDSTAQCDFVHLAPKGAKQRNEDLWFRRLDEDSGQVRVESDDISIWHADEMREPRVPIDTPERMQAYLRSEQYQEKMDTELRLHLAVTLYSCLALLKGRPMHMPEATEAATRAARAVLYNSGRLTDDAKTIPQRFKNAFERAYHRTTIELAGVDLNQHPWCHGYQAFYDLGWPPPSRQEMAEFIITTLGGRTRSPKQS